MKNALRNCEVTVETTAKRFSDVLQMIFCFAVSGR